MVYEYFYMSHMLTSIYMMLKKLILLKVERKKMNRKKS